MIMGNKGTETSVEKCEKNYNFTLEGWQVIQRNM